LDGKFSFAYCGAIALAEGEVDIDSFSDATRFSPRVEALLPKVRIKANPMSRDDRLSKVRACARRSLQPANVERLIGMVEALETLPDLRQLMVILGHKSVP